MAESDLSIRKDTLYAKESQRLIMLRGYRENKISINKIITLMKKYE